jgi:ABC-type microcin C transport system permease subunit YejE
VPPSVVFAIILALTLGFLFHSIFGRRLWQLPCFLVSAVIGVFAGQVVSVFSGTAYLQIGNVPVVMSSLGALALLGLCWFFTAPLQPESSRTRRRARRLVSREEHASA